MTARNLTEYNKDLSDLKRDVKVLYSQIQSRIPKDIRERISSVLERQDKLRLEAGAKGNLICELLQLGYAYKDFVEETAPEKSLLVELVNNS